MVFGNKNITHFMNNFKKFKETNLKKCKFKSRFTEILT